MLCGHIVPNRYRRLLMVLHGLKLDYGLGKVAYAQINRKGGNGA